MKLTLKIKRISVFALLTVSGLAMAQHNTQHGNNLTEPTAVSAHPSAYAGQQERAIKALSAQDTQDWLDGKGMSLAKAAELNGFPGPMHTLELSASLQLTELQRAASQQLLTAHKAEVRRLGADLIQVEQTLDQAFAKHSIDPIRLKELTQRIGVLQAEIRESHLHTHLLQTEILTTRQVAQYKTLRGYDTPAPQTHQH
jgi:Spy/CpxP family protein refolding chaperone